MVDGQRISDGGLLRVATNSSGGGPLEWVAAPLQAATRVLHLCCGADPLAPELPAGSWLGVDPEATAGPPPRVRGEPTAIPVRTSTVDGIALLLALPRLTDLDAVFAELRRVLVPGGTLVLLVPSASARTVAELRLAPVLSGVHRAWRHLSALDSAGWLLHAADFAVVGDDRVSFGLPLPDAGAARDLVDRLPRSGLWPPELPSDVRERARVTLARRAGPGRVLPLPLRRLVARR